MDIAAIVPWLSAAALLISIITAVNTFVNAGAKANGLKLADHEARLKTLEGEVKHLPNRDATHQLELGVKDLVAATKTLEARLSGRMDALDERLKPVAATSARLQEYLLRQAEKG